MPSKTSKTTRNICFTLFEPFPTFPITFDEKTVKYACYQVEKAPDTGKLHVQGYLELKESWRYSRIKELFGRKDIHLEARRGSRDEARDYCRKEESRVDGPWEFGDFGKKQGTRSDLLSVKAAIDKGAKEIEVYEQFFASSARHHKFFAKYISLKAPKRTVKPKAVLFLGPPGGGKTSWIQSQEKDCYWHSAAMGTWFDEYRGETVVVFDDTYGTIPFNMYLGLIDSKPFPVQVKGASMQFMPEKVYVVANRLPETWYKNERGHMDFRAFYRRFDEYWFMDEDHEIQKFGSAEEFKDFCQSNLSEKAQVEEEPRSPVV